VPSSFRCSVVVPLPLPTPYYAFASTLCLSGAWRLEEADFRLRCQWRVSNIPCDAGCQWRVSNVSCDASSDERISVSAASRVLADIAVSTAENTGINIETKPRHPGLNHSCISLLQPYFTIPIHVQSADRSSFAPIDTDSL